MPVVRVNAVSDQLVSVGGSTPEEDIRTALSRQPADAPILLMIHGYKYAPGVAERCPHRSILGLASRSRAKRCLSWPTAMGFGQNNPTEGLCIAFGWTATGSIWRAATVAEQAASALGHLFRILSRLTDRPAHVLAHSLGARVALGGLQVAPAGSVGRMVLLHGAEFRSRGRAALASPAGQYAEVINVTTRENDLFDALFRGCVAPHRPLDPALSAGLGQSRPNWLDMRIDDPETRSALNTFGFDIPAPAGRVCHWSAYMRRGMFDLHRALLRDPSALPLPVLAATLPDGARRGIIDRTFARADLAPLPRATHMPS